jgi:hypothetical protein
MKSLFYFVATFAILASGCLAAADPPTQIGVPVMGYAFDNAVKGIRPLSGFPGAAILGSPVDLGMTAAWSGISPRQDYAVVVGADDGTVRLLSLDAGFTSRSLTPAFQSPALVAFSPNGSAVAIYRRDRPALQIFTHLPKDPALSYEIDLAGLDGDLFSAAISDDGELAILLAGGPDSSGAWLSRSGSSPAPVDMPSPIAALAFQAGTDRAALAARDGSLYLLENLSTARDVRVLAPADDRMTDVVAVRFIPDPARAIVATSRGTVAAFDLAGARTVSVSCGCRPSSLSSLNARMLRLNEISDSPLMLLDTTDPQLHIWFVPALPPADAPGGSAQ